MMDVHGVGVDIASIERMHRLIETYGDSFTGRWFTRGERARCARRAAPSRAFTEVFAAKEAVWKALGAAGWDAPGWDGSVPWRWIDIVAEGAEAPVTARLSGPVAAAHRAGDPDGPRIEVALSSTARVATATAIVHLPVTPR